MFSSGFLLLLYGDAASPDGGHEDGGWSQDQRDDDSQSQDGGLVEVAPEPLRVLVGNVQSSAEQTKGISFSCTVSFFCTIRETCMKLTKFYPK